jgi:TRAP transporter TAXI family solute receptor
MKTLFYAAALSVGIAAAPAAAQMIAVGTASPGSLFHSSASAVAKVINEEAGIRATLQPFASANVYIPAVSEGDIDLGVGTVHEVNVAIRGTEHFSDRPQPGLRAVGVMFPLRFAIFVREDSDIESLADLAGKSIPGGYSSQQIAVTMMNAIYAASDLSESDVDIVPVANTVAGANDFATGKVDAFFFAVGAAKVSEVDAAVGGVRALPFDASDENLAAMREHLPQGYFLEVAPGGNNVGIMEPTQIMAFDAITFASAETSEDTIYAVTKGLHENKDALAAAFPAFRAFTPDNMYKDLAPVEYHPGAVRYFEEIGQSMAN